MFCRNCGTLNPDDGVKCTRCGAPLTRNPSNGPNYSLPRYKYESKFTAGVLMCLFLGIIGLVIGVCIFEGYQKRTFTDGWLKCFFWTMGISFGLTILIFCFAYCGATCAMIR